jgi:Fe-S-cluster containining protein
VKLPSAVPPAIRRLTEALGFTEDPVDLMARLRGLYQDVDQAVRERASAHVFDCKSGCSDCCHESVFVSAPEFLYIASAIWTRFSVTRRQRLLDEMLRLADVFEDELALLEELGPGKERDEVAARIRFRCPLLSESEACSVYEARELNGRTFGMSWDSQGNRPFGCDRTHVRLALYPDAQLAGSLYDARQARRELVARLPGTETVHVYPWWFARYRAFLG